jgi:hypothetical protein
MIGLMIGIVLGLLGGWLMAREQARVAIIGGPDSDNYPQSLSAIAEAKAKIQAGDTNILTQLDKAEAEIRQAQQWTRRFIGQPDGAASGSQMIRPETSSTSTAAGSHR